MAVVPLRSAVERPPPANADEDPVGALLRLRSQIIEIVGADLRMSDGSRLIVIVALDRHLNRDPNHDGFGTLWPSIATVAREQRKSPSMVKRALREARALGYFLVEAAGGGRQTTRYRPALPEDLSGTARPRRRFRRRDKGGDEQYPVTAVTGSQPAPSAGHSQPPHPVTASPLTGSQPAPQSILENQGHSPMRAGTRKAMDQGNVIDTEASGGDFDIAWDAYLHRWSDDQKGLARSAWNELMRQGVKPAIIIAAAGRQASTIGDSQYALHMWRWLLKQREDAAPVVVSDTRPAGRDWKALGAAWAECGVWPDDAGPPPSSAECRMPVGRLQWTRRERKRRLG